MKRIHFSLPKQPFQDTFLQAQRRLPFSYPQLGATRGTPPAGYNQDHHKILLGHGPRAFEKARTALENWQMFPAWVRTYPKPAPLVKGTEVAIFFRLFGWYWTSACRIVYVITEPQRFGFAYGTLPTHVEQGEECFWVEINEAGEVWYHIRAFSKPQYWLARLFKPLARFYQRKFARDSKQAMVDYLWKREDSQLRPRLEPG